MKFYFHFSMDLVKCRQSMDIDSKHCQWEDCAWWETSRTASGEQVDRGDPLVCWRWERASEAWAETLRSSRDTWVAEGENAWMVGENVLFCTGCNWTSPATTLTVLIKSSNIMTFFKFKELFLNLDLGFHCFSFILNDTHFGTTIPPTSVR